MKKYQTKTPFPDYCPIKHNRFNNFVNANIRYFQWLINNFSGLESKDDRDDLMQEVLLSTWKRFDTFSGVHLAGWLKKTVEYCSSNYRQAYVKYKNRNVFGLDFDRIEPVVEEYSEDHLQKLEWAMAKLPDCDQEILAIYLNPNTSLRREAMIQGKGDGYYDKKFSLIKSDLKCLLQDKPPPPRFVRIGEGYHSNKAIIQLTKDGQFVKRWSSAKEAGRGGFNSKNIANVLKGKRPTCQGFVWKYEVKDCETE
ncbi:hypothetical protein [Flavitalea sp.]|nr:hypothetical protein [Flavitalea sp.]